MEQEHVVGIHGRCPGPIGHREQRDSHVIRRDEQQERNGDDEKGHDGIPIFQRHRFGANLAFTARLDLWWGVLTTCHWLVL